MPCILYLPGNSQPIQLFGGGDVLAFLDGPERKREAQSAKKTFFWRAGDFLPKLLYFTTDYVQFLHFY